MNCEFVDKESWKQRKRKESLFSIKESTSEPPSFMVYVNLNKFSFLASSIEDLDNGDVQNCTV